VGSGIARPRVASGPGRGEGRAGPPGNVRGVAPPDGLRFDTISFLSDLGTTDEYVGVVRSVIRSIVPAVGVVDITHGIAPYDTRAGGLALARSVQYLCPGVVLALVDPGIGVDRRRIAVEVGDGAAVLVGPDNGVLAPAVAMVGGATRAFSLDRTDFHLPSAGPVFDGRDVLAPAAAHLCVGVPLEELGTEVDPASLLPGVLPVARMEDDVLVAEVLWADRFGNLQLNIDPDDLAAHTADDAVVGIRSRTGIRTARRVTGAGELGAGQVGLLVDGYGLLSLVVGRGSAGEELGIGPSDEVQLFDADTGPGSAPAPVPVQLTRRDR
jgi:S-adenosylmethionine hydrolase